MIRNVVTVGYGRPASLALARAVAEAKGGAALAPVTVVVPSNFTGLSARRLLGSAELGVAGIANVSFLTPFRLAELLAADQLLSTRPLTRPVLGAAVRRALAASPGPFAKVAEHHATEAALVGMYAELGNISAAARDRVAEHGRTARAAVNLYDAIAGYLGAFHDEAAVLRAAVERPLLAQALEPFGSVVWYLPSATHLPFAYLLSVVLTVAPSSVIVGLTGAEEADDAVLEVCRRAGVRPSPAASEVATADHLVSVTDADEEVRATVRRIVELCGEGVRLDRIGVFYPTAEPYLPVLEQQLAAAELPANGPSRIRLAESVAGRTLLGALALPSRQWRRDRVLALIGGAPLRHRAEPVQPVAWERISRRAGVVSGLDGWSRQLGELARTCRDDAGRTGVDPGRSAHLSTDAGQADGLARFVHDLAAAVFRVDRATGWSAKSEQATELLHQVLGPVNRRAFWPEPEMRAFDGVEAALQRLAALELLEPDPSQDVFLRALRAELDAAGGRNGRFGIGVLYGPLAAAVGHDLDAVFVLGCAEGLWPSPRRDDAMLSDEARKLARGELALRSSRLHDQHRSLLAALAAAPQGRRTMLFSRGDLRSGREALPSRWLLDSAAELVGMPVPMTEFAELRDPVVHVVASFAAGQAASPVAADLAERDLVAMTEAVAAGCDPLQHPLAALVGRGLLAQRERVSARFTEWDGNVSAASLPPVEATVLSSSRLETWATCGFRYLLAHELGIGERDDPERVVELSALDRGSLLHEVLERFFSEAIDRGVPDPDQSWGDAGRERAFEIAAEVFEDYERRARTGRPLLWQMVSAQLLEDLDRFLAEDDQYRRSTGSSPERVEWAFGPRTGVDPVRLDLPDGRHLLLSGRADRVDRTADGRVVVFDYKTGKAARYKVLDADPVDGGKLLQLGLYAQAGMQHLGADRASAYYWLIRDKPAVRRIGFEWDDARHERFVDVVGTIATGIEQGIFDAVPGEWDHFHASHSGCRYCPFDRICPSGRSEMAEAKADDPLLGLRSALSLPEPA